MTTKIPLLIVCLALLSCNNIVDSMMYSYSEPEDFQYYQKDYQLGENESLKTNGF